MIVHPKRPFLTKRWVYRLSKLELEPFKFPDEESKNYEGDTPNVGNLVAPNIIVSEEIAGKDCRRYALFENYVQVFRFCEHLRSEGQIPHLYEISPYFMKLHFDIDIKLGNGDQPENEMFEGQNRYYYVLRPCLESIDEVFSKLFPAYYDPEEIINNLLVFEAHRQDKISFHVVVDGYYLPCHENYIFFREVVENMAARGYVSQSAAVDFSVYKKNQSFRMFGSNKATMKTKEGVKQVYNGPPLEMGPGRIFSREGILQSCFRNETVVDDRLRNLRILERSLLSNTLGNVRLTPPHSVKKQRLRDVGFSSNPRDNVSMTDEDIKSILTTFSDHPSSKTEDGSRAFSFTKFVSRGGFLCLKRIKSSHCAVCDKDHGGENAFLYCSPTGDIKFVCRRAQESKKGGTPIYVGRLDH